MTDTAVEALLVAEIHLAAAVLAVVAQVQIGKTVEEYSSAVFFIKNWFEMYQIYFNCYENKGTNYLWCPNSFTKLILI